MSEVIDARTIAPRDDMASKLLNDEVSGRRLTAIELDSLCNLLFQAGMDTVANFASFFFLHLGGSPELQREIQEHPERIANVIEEGFRKFGVVNNGRLAAQDTTLGGVNIHKDDMIVCMLPLAGLDERRNPQPERFDSGREARSHMLFSQGVHMCIGHQLARMEMRILLEEWSKVIPTFRVADGYTPNYRAGMVMGLSKLPLEWALSQ